jgi:hypothetical protein
MKRLFGIIVSLLVLQPTTYLFAQASATGSASATIVTPIAIAKAVDMNFGNVAISTSLSGVVVLAPAGTRSAGGAGGVTLPSTAGTVAAATFTVSGQASYTYAITLPAAAILSSGSNTMTVSGFASAPATIGTLSGTGTQSLKVGATLNVSAAQASGTYTNASAVPVTVNYN